MNEIYTPMESALLTALLALEENLEIAKQRMDELEELKQEVEL